MAMMWKRAKAYKEELLQLQEKLRECNYKLEKAYAQIENLDKELDEYKDKLNEAMIIIAYKDKLLAEYENIISQVGIEVDNIKNSIKVDGAINKYRYFNQDEDVGSRLPISKEIEGMKNRLMCFLEHRSNEKK